MISLCCIGDNMEKISCKQNLRKKQNQEYAFLTIIMALGSLIIFYRYLFCGDLFLYFGDANDDTFQSYLPLYQMVTTKLQNFDLTLMNFNWGAGTNILSAQANLINPFVLPLYIGGMYFGGEWIASALVWYQIIQIFCSGYAVLFFLNRFELEPIARVIASAAFAFSAYSIGGIGQHYFFASFPFFMALFLGEIEQALHNEKKLPILSLITALLCICSIYVAYMVLLSASVYTLMRCIFSEKIEIHEKIGCMANILIAVIIGILLSAVIFIPVTYLFVFGSTRIGAKADWISWFQINDVKAIKSTFLRFFSDVMEGSVNRWKGYDTAFNVPHLYMSGLLIACIPQHIAGLKKASSKTRIGIFIAYGIFFYSLLFPFVGVTYNFFVAYTGRYIFTFLPLAAFLVAKVISEAIRNDSFSYLAAGISVLLSIVAFLASEKSSANNIVLTVSASAAPIIAVLWIHCLARKNPIQHPVGWKIIRVSSITVVALAVVVEGWGSLYYQRGIVTKSTYHTIYTDEIEAMFQSLQEETQDDFYRMEYAYNGWTSFPTFGNAMTAGYYGISAYNSVLSGKYQEYHRYFGNPYDAPSDTSVAYAYGQLGLPLDKTMADIWGIRYLISTYPGSGAWKQTGPFESQVANQFWVLENRDIDSMGIIYYSWYPEYLLDDMTALQRQSALSQAVSLNMPAINVPTAVLSSGSEIEIDNKEIRLENAESCIEIPIYNDVDLNQMEETRYWLAFQVQAEMETTLTISVDTGYGFEPFNWQNGTWDIQPVDSNKEYVLPISNEVIGVQFHQSGDNELTIKNIKMIFCNEKNYSTTSVHSSLLEDSSQIFSSVSMDRNGIFVMPICADCGWTVYVDGVQKDLLVADKCFMAVELSAGDHEVIFKYRTPFLDLGILITAVGGVAFIIMCIVVCKKNKKL